MRRCTIVLLFLLPLALVTASPASEPARSSPEQIRRWIEQLDHDDFAVREQAAAALARAGHPAIMPLAEGTLSQNPEVAWRSSETLERMAMEGDEATMDRIVHVLGDLAKRGKPGLAQFASEMRERQRTFRHNRAAMELRKLGGHVSGGSGEGYDIADVDVAMGPALMVDLLPEVEEAAPEPIAEAPAMDIEKPAWLRLLESLKLVGAKPAADDLEIIETEIVEGGAPVERAELPPAGIFGGLKRALGKVEEKVIGAIFEPVLPHDMPFADEDFEPPTDFRLPPLDLEDEGLEDLAADEIFPGEEMADGEEMEVPGPAEIVEIGGPVFIGGGMFGGMMMADGEGMPGVMSLTREWRGGDNGLKHLKDLSGITNLQIEHAELSDAALPHIAKLASLKHLQIRGGKFSRDALRTFHRQKPNVSIMAMGEGMMGVNGQFDAGGCVLDTVFPGSAAHDAGLQAGDKITAIAGEPVNDFSDLTISVSTRKAGDKLKVIYQRDGQQHETDVTLKQRAAGQ